MLFVLQVCPFIYKRYTMNKILLVLVMFLGVGFFAQPAKAVSFAPNDPGVNIGTHLDRGYEPSGVVWHGRTHSLFLVWDNGYVTQMDTSGNILHPSVFVGGDLEDITVVDDQTNSIYLLEEYPQKIVEFDISTWTKTGRVWSLNGMPGNAADGAEALTYNAETHEFYVGAQMDGQIYVYAVDLQNSGSVNFSRVIHTGVAADIAGLNYSADTKKVYAVFDSANILQEYDASNDHLLTQYDVPGVDQEGLTVLPGCPHASTPIIIAEDSGRVMKYQNYPVVCPNPSQVDNDHDGFTANVDCNDNNPAINPGSLEFVNDGLDNDCSSRTPDQVKTFQNQSLLHRQNVETRGDYQVLDAPGEYVSFILPANLQAGWYRFEVEAKSNERNVTPFELGVALGALNVPQMQTRNITSNDWSVYTFHNYIPANRQTEIRIITNVSGKRAEGGKREHQIRKVVVTRLERAPNPLERVVLENFQVNAMRGNKADISARANLEVSGTLSVNGQMLPSALLSKSKVWKAPGFACGHVYNYQIKLYPDFYNPEVDNALTKNGQISMPACR